MSGEDQGRAPFGHLKLKGGRYDQPGLPVSSAAELERYSRLVTTVARALYLNAHPRRKRLPRNFDDGLDLRLTAVEIGSVVPVLSRRSAENAGQFALAPPADWHEQARKLINEALYEVTNANKLPAQFPRDGLKELAQFGRSLHADERIELSDSKYETPAVLTLETRKQIQQLAQLDELEIETVLLGQITGLLSSPQRADLVIIEDDQPKKVTASYSDPTTWDALREHLGYAKDAPLASLTVVATQARDGRITNITDVLDVEFALPPEWTQRVVEVGALSEGWLEIGVEAPSKESVDRTQSVLLACVDAGFERPGIFPSIDGGIQLEWRNANRTVEVAILNSGLVEALWYGKGTDDSDERIFDVFGADDVVEFIEGALGG